MRGRFVTFEGIDGCGKTTQLRLLFKTLKKQKIRVRVTREPGGTPLAEKIRALILAPRNRGLSPRCELLLYLAARAQHVEEKIRPALEQGRLVLCDRFADATFAYQGGGRNLKQADIRRLNRFACAGLSTDLTFLFDLPAKTALERVSRGRRMTDRMEKEGVRFMEKVRQAYLALAKAGPGRFRVIDASRGISEIRKDVFSHWKKWVCKTVK